MHQSKGWCRAMMERWKRRDGPLGGCSDTTQSPSRKLIMENMGKSCYCRCYWAMEKINSFTFECQRQGEKSLWEKEYLGKEELFTGKLNIHHCHTPMISVCAQHHKNERIIVKALKVGVVWICCWQQSFIIRTVWKHRNEKSLKAASKQSKDAF